VKAALAVVALLGTAVAARGGELAELGRIAVPADVKVRFLMVSPDGRQLTAACGDHRLRVWPVAGGASAPLRTLEVGGDGVSALAYSFDGTWLAAGTGNGTVAVFRAATGERAARFEVGDAIRDRGRRRVSSLAISPDGSRVAVAVVDAAPEVWDAPAAKRRAVLTTRFGGSNALEFSPDGARLASADEDTAIRIYDADGRLRTTVDAFPLETFALAFTSDGRQLAVAGPGKEVALLDSARGSVVRRLPRQEDPILWMAARRRSAEVVTGSFKERSMDIPGPTLGWPLDGAAPRVLARDRQFIGGGALADGRVLLASAADGAVVLWALP
jgi:WD40 repeat protein